jgi:hypothetical protein
LSTKNRGAAKHCGNVHSVSHQAAGLGDLDEPDRGDPIFGRKIDQRCEIGGEYRVLEDSNRFDALFAHRCKRAGEFAWAPQSELLKLQLQ